jgi:hypothetical protein
MRAEPSVHLDECGGEARWLVEPLCHIVVGRRRAQAMQYHQLMIARVNRLLGNFIQTMFGA